MQVFWILKFGPVWLQVSLKFGRKKQKFLYLVIPCKTDLKGASWLCKWKATESQWECRQFLEAGIGKGIGPTLMPPEMSQPCWNVAFSWVWPISTLVSRIVREIHLILLTIANRKLMEIVKEVCQEFSSARFDIWKNDSVIIWLESWEIAYLLRILFSL